MNLYEFKKENSKKICNTKPCLWAFRVEKVKEKLGWNLGNRFERPGITFSLLMENYLVVFLTRKTNGELSLNLKELCKSLCEGLEEEKVRVFRDYSSGIRIFRLPAKFINDVATYCSSCEEEVKNLIEKYYREEL